MQEGGAIRATLWPARIRDLEMPTRRQTGMNEEPVQTFGARLRGFREAAGLTQEQLADRAGLSANAISALERGERRRPYPTPSRR